MLHKFYCLQEVNVLLIFFVNLMTNFRTWSIWEWIFQVQKTCGFNT
jgi:hypothetical protein